jgi:hypothetical protein
MTPGDHVWATPLLTLAGRSARDGRPQLILLGLTVPT